MKRKKQILKTRLIILSIIMAFVIVDISMWIMFANLGISDGLVYMIVGTILVSFIFVLLIFLFLTLMLRVTTFKCNSKTYYVYNGATVGELYEGDKIVDRIHANVLYVPGIVYNDNEGNTIKVNFGAFGGVDFKFNNTLIEPSK